MWEAKTGIAGHVEMAGIKNKDRHTSYRQHIFYVAYHVFIHYVSCGSKNELGRSGALALAEGLGGLTGFEELRIA